MVFLISYSTSPLAASGNARGNAPDAGCPGAACHPSGLRMLNAHHCELWCFRDLATYAGDSRQGTTTFRALNLPFKKQKEGKCLFSLSF